MGALIKPVLITAGVTMIEDFFIRSLLAGVGLALVAGPLGCFVIWRQMAFFGETMAHSALLGAALSLALEIDILWGVLAIILVVAGLLLALKSNSNPVGQLFSNDSLLGILSHSALALGLVVVGLMSWLRLDILSFLVGDVLSVSNADLMAIYGGGLAILIVLAFIWQPLLLATVSKDIAQAEGRSPARVELILVLLLAVTIAIAIKIVGVLLITALLIIPAATARRFSATPEQMAMFAVIVGILAVVGGLFGSLQFDTPSGPSIVVAAMMVFVASLATRLVTGRKGKER